jgi:NADH-quinone oxidoreductase subunit A
MLHTVISLKKEQLAFLYLFFSILAILALMLGAAWLGRFIRPHRPSPAKNTTYESGIEPVGNALGPINTRLQAIGCIFILFELEAILLFPWALTIGNNLSMEANLSFQVYKPLLGTFMLLIWALGLAYVFNQRHVLWGNDHPIQKANPIKGPVPAAHYERINKQYAAIQPYKNNQ